VIDWMDPSSDNGADGGAGMLADLNDLAAIMTRFHSNKISNCNESYADARGSPIIKCWWCNCLSAGRGGATSTGRDLGSQGLLDASRHACQILP
jgi:hypothetical protein